MKNPEKLISTINDAKIPAKYDLQAWEMEALRSDANGDLFTLISKAFVLGYLKGQKAGKEG